VTTAELANDTIAAIATAPGEGGIAVVRISGPAAGELATTLLSLDPAHLLHRGIHVARVQHGPDGRVLDEVLALWMPAPRSYTREDVLELQCHGGYAAAQAVLGAVLARGARLAEPGEFTLRAFLNGRLDLVQAEAVADVIQARTATALAVHEELLAGKLSETVEDWQQRLGQTLALMEAHLDFSEEDDVGEFAAAPVLRDLRPLVQEMEGRLHTFRWGSSTREGFRVVLVGVPNTGKSSLLNALTEEDRAIVSPYPGTTRDAIEVWITAHGIPVQLTDTAGLRSTVDAVEGQGVARARAAAAKADLVVFVADGGRPLHVEERDEARRLVASARPALAVSNKSDLGAHSAAELAAIFGAEPVLVSARTGAGLQKLLRCWAELARGGAGADAEAPLTRRRHQEAVSRATAAVQRAIAIVETDGYLEAAAGELHGARRDLAKLLGWGSPEDVLDAVFSAFCVGK